MLDFLTPTHAAVAKTLGTSLEKGLSEGEARRRLEKFGVNRLSETPKPPWWMGFLGQFKDFMIMLLLVAAAVSFALGEAVDAAAIFAIVLLNAIIGFVQEERAEKALEALRKMVSPRARVLRGGVEASVESWQLVPGDIILLEAGDQVPADARLFKTASFECNESSLTGESLPAGKDAGVRMKIDSPVAERKGMVFMGTTVARGLCRAVVVATGMETEFGKIAAQVQSVDSGQTPLQGRLEKAGKTLSVMALAIVAIVFVTGIAKGAGALEMFMTAVSLAVAAVPEGLPAIVTITLAVGVQRMVKRSAIIRKLHAVETLGSATVICSDKTGTLTRNEMTVRKVMLADGSALEVTGAGYALDGKVLRNGKPAALEKVLRLAVAAGALCNSASLETVGRGVRALGDPTEASLLVLARKAGFSEADEGEFFKEGELPFDSDRKMMSVACRSDEGVFVFSKGAPEVVLQKCNRIFAGGKLPPLDANARQAFLKANEAWAGRALRVLAVAFKPLSAVPKMDESIERDLVFLGLVAMNDPPREEAKRAVRLAGQAGIRVVMITGDNPLTAKAIASELGIISAGGRVVTGVELEKMSNDELVKAAGATAVYARVTAGHKLRIVAALKARGEVVAMTGDGVNDAPALKKADIGIAMGITGTDVSKQASDMVLSDDNFASIVNAVEEGRVIYSNIVKSVRFLLSCNVGEVLTLFIATMLLDARLLPLLPVQILWMNLVTDGLPALALGMEKAEPGVMERKPRKKNEGIISWRDAPYFLSVGLLMAAGTLALFLLELSQGSTPEKARTIAFTTIILFQLFHALNSRAEKHSVFHLGAFSNRMMLVAVGGALALQIIVVQTPLLEAVFKTEAMTLAEWLLSIAVASSVLVLVELWKAVERRKGSKV